MPQHQYDLAGLTVLHMAQPVEGGVARVVTDLVRGQASNGARVVVACPPEGSLPGAAAAAGAEIVTWPAGRSPGPALARETGTAGRLVRAVRPSLLHLHSAKAGLAARLAVRGGLPTVFQPHAWSFDAVTGTAARAAVRWERYAARWTDRVLCVSDAERRAGQNAGVPAQWSVIPNGVDLARFTPADRTGPARSALPALSDLRPAAPLVVCVGRLCPQKGQDVLLRAWTEVAARLPESRLVLVGEGPDHRRLLRDAPRGVLFAGAPHDTVPWYQAADVVVLPSRWEGMALAPLEAMACGRPVVVTDVSGARESVPAADAGSCIVPAEDEHALAAALLRLLTDGMVRADAGHRALDHAREHHDVRRTVDRVAALYRELLTPLPASEVWEGIAR
jgi:glycosyltransferase involved in cell wall biosynthesis